MASIAFDASGIDPTPRFDALPAGEYPVIITQSQLKFTKDGNGQYLELRLEIQGGEFAGRLLFDRLNLHNANAQAVDIAQRQLAQICHAVGIMQVQDSEQLHHRPMIAIVKVRPARDNYEASNEVKGYKPATVTAAAAPQRPTAPPTPAKAAAPWARRAAV